MDTELPADFAFGWFIDGPSLEFRGEVIAAATPANHDPNPLWRLRIDPRCPPRYVFLASEQACRRYMAAWARKWEAQIRERLAHPPAAFSDLGSGTGGPALNTTHHRRSPRRGSGRSGITK